MTGNEWTGNFIMSNNKLQRLTVPVPVPKAKHTNDCKELLALLGPVCKKKETIDIDRSGGEGK